MHTVSDICEGYAAKGTARSGIREAFRRPLATRIAHGRANAPAARNDATTKPA
jgi:hypothetical protein